MHWNVSKFNVGNVVTEEVEHIADVEKDENKNESLVFANQPLELVGVENEPVEKGANEVKNDQAVCYSPGSKNQLHFGKKCSPSGIFHTVVHGLLKEQGKIKTM